MGMVPTDSQGGVTRESLCQGRGKWLCRQFVPSVARHAHSVARHAPSVARHAPSVARHAASVARRAHSAAGVCGRCVSTGHSSS